MMKLKVGDKVEITKGKDKGRTGKIEKIFPKKTRVLVPGLNIYKKHVKGVSEQKGGIYDIPRPLDVSKLILVCPKCKKKSRIGFKLVGKTKERYCKKCNRTIDSKK